MPGRNRIGHELEPAREQRPGVAGHLLTARLERLEQPVERARAADLFERSRVVRHPRPLGGHLARDLYVELDGVGAHAHAGSSKLSLCHWSVAKLAGRSPSTGSSRPASVSSTSRTPTSGAAPV